MPQRDIEAASADLTIIFHPGFGGNDEKYLATVQRLQKMMPAHITPAFKTGENTGVAEEQGEIRAAALARKPGDEMQRTQQPRSAFDRCIQNYSFDNYRVECGGQMNALSKTRRTR